MNVSEKSSKNFYSFLCEKCNNKQKELIVKLRNKSRTLKHICMKKLIIKIDRNPLGHPRKLLVHQQPLSIVSKNS